MPEWLLSLGYLGAFLGAIVEGEVMLLTAIQLSRMVPSLHISDMIGCFLLGTLTADWSFYWIGRKHGKAWVGRSAKWAGRFHHMEQLFARRALFLLLTYRFMYGFRIILPVLFGAANVHPLRFAICSLCSTLTWITLFGYLGYHFTEWAFASVQRVLWIILAILLTATGMFLLRYRYQHLATASAKKD